MLWIIVKKELTRVFTDKRLVFSAFILPALSIFILYSLMGKMMGSFTNDIEEHTSVVAVLQAPESFKAYSEQAAVANHFEFKYDTMTKEAAIIDIKAGDVDLLVAFPEGFDEYVKAYDQGQAAPEIQTFFNPSKEYSSAAHNTFAYNYLKGYENGLLAERFGDLSKLSPFVVDATNKDSEIIEEGKALGVGLSMILPMLLSIMLFAGAMGIGIDTIAGEKERGTMATLLLAPISRETIALGKVLGLGIVAIISAMCSLLAIVASMPNASEFLAGGADVSLSSLAFTPMHYFQLLVLMIAQVGVYVAIICLVSVKARSVKEAGTYVSPIYMVVMIGAFSTMFSHGKIPLVQFAIPVYGCIASVKELLMFELTMNEFLIAVGVSFALIAILVKLITMTFNSEKDMFNA